MGIMQPYFFPYIGYFQLINSVDKFVLWDCIKYTKKGWINRNRILIEGKESPITVPIMGGCDRRCISDIHLSATWEKERGKLLRKIEQAYRKAPLFDTVFDLVKKCVLHNDYNLFNFLTHAVREVAEYLDLHPCFIIASSVDVDHSLQGEEKVIAVCKAEKAGEYVNAIGGQQLYHAENFNKSGIRLGFMHQEIREYNQGGGRFTPYLSIVDVMMYNSREKATAMAKSGEVKWA